jgi:oligopeptide/dipeptide ABC transporter ATP-binding protein
MTALWFIAAVALPCWGTYALVAAGSRALPRTTATTILRLCLASGIGWGWGSGTYYLWLLAFGRPQGMYLAVDALFWCLLSFLFREHSNAGNRFPSLARGTDVNHCDERARPHAALRRTLMMAFATVLAVALAGLVGQALAEPNGGWDAWAIWNLRARFLYRLGDDWPQALAGAFPAIGDETYRMKPSGLGGDPPDPQNIPSGCSFHPRCPLAFDECPTIDPTLYEAGPGRRAACLLVRQPAATEVPVE